MNRSTIAFSLLPILAPALAALGQAPATRPLTLHQAVEFALARAPGIAAARAQANEVAALARKAEAGFAPQAFATTTPGYSTGLPVAVAGQVPSVAGFEVQQTLFDPARRAEVLEAQAQAAGRSGVLARSTAETLRALVIAYGRNWADQMVVTDARQALESREAIFRRVLALAREGRRTDLEVEQASLEVARAKQGLADRETESDLDRLELAHLMDWPAGETLIAAEDPLTALAEPVAGDSLVAARDADPELQALALQAERLERAADLQKRTWLPVIQAEAQYLRLANYNNFDQYFVKFKPNDLTIGVSVVIPVWTGGRLKSGETAATARLDNVHAQRRGREHDLELTVRRAETDLARALAQLELATRGVALARDGARIAQALAAEGRGDPDDVDVKTMAISKAEDDRVQASLGLLAARAHLLELTGELAKALAG